VELSFSVLLAVSCRLSTGSRNERSVDIEGAKSEATIRKDRKSVRCVFRVFSFLTRLIGGQSSVGAGRRTMHGQVLMQP
jgi:competence transcription factor ComK